MAGHCRRRHPVAAAALTLLLLLVTSRATCAFPTTDADDVRLSLLSVGDDALPPPSPQLPKQQSPRKRDQSPLLQPASAENVIRPLENIADRFLKSETVGVVDSIAAQAIEAFARFVDGAGLAVVNIIDGIPDTINRVADTVEGMVTTADHIGRN